MFGVEKIYRDSPNGVGISFQRSVIVAVRHFSGGWVEMKDTRIPPSGDVTPVDLEMLLEEFRTEQNIPVARSICFVTEELPGLFRNGGAGTAAWGLIEGLLEKGHKITVLYAAPVDLKDVNKKTSALSIRALGIDLYFLDEVETYHQWQNSQVTRSYVIYEWLKARAFDIIHFHDFGGCAFYACHGKRGNQAFQNTILCIVTHGSSRWGWGIMEQFIRTPEMLERDYLERRALELADYVLSPSDYLIRWMRNSGLRLPKNTYRQRNIMPRVQRESKSNSPERYFPVREIVFFGRHEPRKGFHIFVEAISRLGSEFGEPKITFLGKFGLIFGEHSAGYAIHRLRHLPNELTFLSSFDRDEALTYLNRPGVLAVMPSCEENMPSVVYECTLAGVNFIATNTGGTPEMLDERSRVVHLCDYTVEAVLAKLREALSGPLEPARLSFSPQSAESAFLDWHALVPTSVPSVGTNTPRPLVSLVVIHFDRPHLLRQALTSIEAQTYQNIEIVVVDDGSTTKIARTMLTALRSWTGSRPLRLVETPNIGLARARNAGARVAEGEYLLFMDDDNLAMPEMVERLLEAAHGSGAPILTCLSYTLRSESAPREDTPRVTEYLPLGGSATIGFFRNCFGDANALFNRRIFQELGGFAENRIAAEDWEFFVRAILKGHEVFIVPEPLFWYRIHPKQLTGRDHSYWQYHTRVVDLYVNNPHPAMRDLLYLAQGQNAASRMDSNIWHALGDREHGEIQRQLIGSVADDEECKRLVSILLAEYKRYKDASRMVIQCRFMEERFRHLNALIEQGFVEEEPPISGNRQKHERNTGVRVGKRIALISSDMMRRFEYVTTLDLERLNFAPMTVSLSPNAWPEANEIVVHPVGGRDSIAVLPFGLGRDAIGVRGSILVNHPNASRIKFRLVAIDHMSTPGDLLERWQQAVVAKSEKIIGPQDGENQISLSLPPHDAPLDLLLITNVDPVGGSMDFAHAIFRKLEIIF
jgi:glycosyltransferase involved in cell wall biosynthesis